MIRKIVLTLMLVILSVGTAYSQQAANFLSGGPVITFKQKLNIASPAIGGALQGEFRLPMSLAFTQDLRLVGERANNRNDGRTFQSTSGIQYHFSNGFFARTAFELTNQKDEFDSRTSSRFRYGGGYQIRNSVTEMPILRFTVEGFTPIVDSEGARGLSVAADAYYTLNDSPYGVGVKTGVDFTEAHNSVFTQVKKSGASSFIEARFFVNLTAIGGK